MSLYKIQNITPSYNTEGYEKVFAEKDRYIVAPEKNVLMIEATVA